MTRARPPDYQIKQRAARFNWRRKYPVKSMLRLAKKRNRGLGWDIEEIDIVIPTHCPVLGISLEMGTRTQKDGSPSLDRINPKKGYVKGNVMVISWRANRLKSDATLEEIEAIRRYMKRHIK